MNPFFYFLICLFFMVLPVRGQTIYSVHHEAFSQNIRQTVSHSSSLIGVARLRQPLGVKNLLSADFSLSCQNSYRQIDFQYVFTRFPGWQSHQFGSQLFIPVFDQLLVSAALGVGVHRATDQLATSWFVRMNHAFLLKVSSGTRIWLRMADWLDMIWPDNNHLYRATFDCLIWQRLSPHMEALFFLRSGQKEWINLGAGVSLTPAQEHQLLITCGIYPAGFGIGYLYKSEHWILSFMLAHVHLMGVAPLTQVQWSK